MNLDEAVRAIRTLRSDLRRISDKDQEQEVGQIALPVIDAVLVGASHHLTLDDPVINALGGLITPEAIAAGEPIRALDAYLVTNQLFAALERAQANQETSDSGDWQARAAWSDDTRHGPGIILRITALRGGAFAWFRCYVTLPDEGVVNAMPRRGTFPSPTSSVAVHYPGDFRSSPAALTDGGYEAHWFGHSGLRPDSGRFFLAASLFQIFEGRLR